ncbi:MAG: ROK family protein [Planctomycetota bacterium]|jgi:glucokinase
MRPGPANYREGVIINSTNMPTFRNVPIRQMLSDSLGVPVAFDNDANVACFGEFSSGAGKDVNDMVFFTLGTGIGGGIVSNGRLIQGSGGERLRRSLCVGKLDGQKSGRSDQGRS